MPGRSALSEASIGHEAAAGTSGFGPADSFRLANDLCDQGKLAEAEFILIRLGEIIPNSSARLSRLGDLRLQFGDRPAARTYFEQAANGDLALPWPHLGLSRIAEEENDLAAAIAHCRKALEIAPDLAVCVERLRALEKKLAAPEAAPAPIQDSFAHRFESANRLLDDRRYAEAEVIYRELLQSDRRSAALHCKVAEIAGEFGRWEEMASHLDAAEAVDPAFPWTHVGRADLLEIEKDYAGAEASLARALELDPSLKFILSRVDRLRRKSALAARFKDAGGVHVWQPNRLPADGPERQRLTVVSWDLAHNPVGRAWLLADMANRDFDSHLLGPVFPAFGDDLWTPLRDSDRQLPVSGYQATSFKAFVEGAIRLVKDNPSNLVWVSKPRFPSIFIGCLYKHIHGSAVVCDIDDDELAFVDATEPLTVQDVQQVVAPGDWNDPYSQKWTQLAQTMIGWCDAVTVCNAPLRQRHGGTIIRHARDEAAYDPARFDRNVIRAEFGFSPADKVILFLGTPRQHKGLLDIAEALEELRDPLAVLLVIGSIADRELKERLGRFRSARIVLRPDQPFSRAAELNAIADLVCVMQDRDSPIALAQTPAKISDALAMGAAVVATPVPPLLEFIEANVATAETGTGLTEALRVALATADRDQTRARARDYFIKNLSYAANRPLAAQVLREALERNAPLPPAFDELIRFIDREMPGSISAEVAGHLGGLVPLGSRIGRLNRLDDGLNVVFFWKQNDSGLYGRRQDMMLKALASSPNVRKILHIDAPISVDRLQQYCGGGGRSEQRLVAANTLSRHLRTGEDSRIARRSFIYRAKETKLLGHELPHKDSFPNHVEQWMRELGFTGNTLAWVCPVAPMFPEVQERIGFPFVVADVIDNQNLWPLRAAYRAEIEENYRRTFAASDIAVANCQPVLGWLQNCGLNAHLVPNGVEIHRDVESWEVPASLAGLRSPIIGYCGNMNDRFDWALVEEVARRRPDWSIVLIGTLPATQQCEAVIGLPNVHALGVIPYDSALRHMAAFDVAMIPHELTELSQYMNPLKLYVYRSLGLPVVSSPVANIADLSSEIAIAASPWEFCLELEAAVSRRHRDGRQPMDAAKLAELSWSKRLGEIMAAIGAIHETRPGTPM